MKERKPSEIIGDFLDLLKESQERYDKAQAECEDLDSAERARKWAHKFEFASNKQERNRLGTAFQNERRLRRKYKDIVDLYKTVRDFASSENNKAVLKRLNGMLNIQKHQEEYLDSKREYKGGDENDSDRGQSAAR